MVGGKKWFAVSVLALGCVCVDRLVVGEKVVRRFAVSPFLANFVPSGEAGKWLAVLVRLPCLRLGGGRRGLPKGCCRGRAFVLRLAV